MKCPSCHETTQSVTEKLRFCVRCTRVFRISPAVPSGNRLEPLAYDQVARLSHDARIALEPLLRTKRKSP